MYADNAELISSLSKPHPENNIKEFHRHHRNKFLYQSHENAFLFFPPPSINKRDASDGRKTNRFTSLERGMKMKANHTLKTFSLHPSAGFSRWREILWKSSLILLCEKWIDRFTDSEEFFYQHVIWPQDSIIAIAVWWNGENPNTMEKQNDEKLLCCEGDKDESTFSSHESEGSAWKKLECKHHH